MKVLEIRRFDQNAVSNEPTEGAHLSRAFLMPGTGALTPEFGSDAVDSLIESLSAADPTFAKLFVDASKDLAPLALHQNEGVTLTSLRMAAGLTQTQFGNLIGQRQSNISLMESGKRDNLNRDTMKKMCGVLGCDMNTLDAAITNSCNMLADHLARLEEQHMRRQTIQDKKSA